ncbi:MAG: 4Fe-4S ferredoxin, partial [Saccharolobus sp.]
PWRSNYAADNDITLLSQAEYYNVWTANGVVQLGAQGNGSTYTEGNGQGNNSTYTEGNNQS